MFDALITEIGNYSKGWYGDFTGQGEKTWDDLKIIIGHLCGMYPEHVDRKGIFIEVAHTFNILATKRDPYYNWMYTDLYKDTFFPNFPGLENRGLPPDQPDTRMLNKMLCIIAQLEVKYFPGEVMVMDSKLAKLFPNGDERIARRKELGFEIKD